MLSNQLQGFCNVLRTIIVSNQKTGATTIKILKKFHRDVLAISSGPCVNDLPEIDEIDENSSTADILVYAEILKETNNGFSKPADLKDLFNISNLISNIDFFSKIKK